MIFIDFSTPPWLITSYHVIGTASLFLNSLGVYLLMYQSDKLEKIRYYMLTYQISCFMADVHLTFLMQAVPLYPMFSGFSVGALSEWFDVPLHYSLVYILFVVVIELEFLILCFEKKHQTIARTLNTHVLPAWFLRFCYFMFLVDPIVVSAWFHTFRLPKDDQWMVIRRDWPQYIRDFESLAHFDVYIKTWSFVIFVVTIVIAGGMTLLVYFLAFILDIFRMMINLKLKISPVRYQKHREAIQSLMVQFATSSFCIVPPFILGIIVIQELDHAQLLTELCILWFAAHSSTNMIGLLIFFPPYRNYLLKQLRLIKPIEKLMNGGRASTVVQPSTVVREQRSPLSFVEVS